MLCHMVILSLCIASISLHTTAPAKRMYITCLRIGVGSHILCTMTRLLFLFIRKCLLMNLKRFYCTELCWALWIMCFVTMKFIQAECQFITLIAGRTSLGLLVFWRFVWSFVVLSVDQKPYLKSLVINCTLKLFPPAKWLLKD